jgi:hypothetical protein
MNHVECMADVVLRVFVEKINNSMNNVVRMKMCPICRKVMSDQNYDIHYNACLQKTNAKPISKDMKLCLLCKKEIPADSFTSHFKECRSKRTEEEMKKITIKNANENLPPPKKGGCGCGKK